jgi:hypothetical protein
MLKKLAFVTVFITIFLASASASASSSLQKSSPQYAGAQSVYYPNPYTDCGTFSYDFSVIPTVAFLFRETEAGTGNNQFRVFDITPYKATLNGELVCVAETLYPYAYSTGLLEVWFNYQCSEFGCGGQYASVNY